MMTARCHGPRRRVETAYGSLVAATRLVLLAGFLTFGCSAEPPPAAPPTSTSPPPSSTMAVADPALVLSQLEMVYGGDLSACPTGGTACGEAITNVGETADAMIRIVGENPSMEHRDEIVSAAEELGKPLTR